MGRVALMSAIAVWFIVATAAYAGSAPHEVVKAAKQFAIGGVGVAGIITPEEIACRQIRETSNAESQFRQLLREATVAGRMYALFGLRQLDVADYDSLAAPFRRNTDPMTHVMGCMIVKEPVADVVRWIDRNAKQIREWEKPR